MRAQKPSNMRRHNTLRDCCSQDPTVTDTVLAKDRVRSKHVETDSLTSNAQTTVNNLEIKGQTQFPDNFHEQLKDHFEQTGHPLRAPRIITDSATIQGMLSVRNNTNLQNVSADGPIDARGDINCFGTAHFYGPIKIHGSFEVDQVTSTRTLPPSLLDHCTERPKDPKEDELTSPIPYRKIPPPPQPVVEVIPVQTFQCKQLHAEQIKSKDSIETKTVQTQRLFGHSAEMKDLTVQSIQTQTLLAEDGIRTGHLHALTGLVESLDVASKIQAQSVQVGLTLESHSVESTISKAKHATNETTTSQKTITKQLEAKHAVVDTMDIKQALEVKGNAVLHEKTTLVGPIVAKDKLQCESSFTLSDRIESEVGRPIQMKQLVEFQRPLCLSRYQYFIFNTEQTSLSKPYQIVIHDDSQILVVDSDRLNILTLSIKLPANPCRGQLVQITTNPSISTVSIVRPIVSAPTTMPMGSSLSFVFVDECKKWFPLR